MTTTTLNLNPIIKLTQQQFYTLCATNPNTKLELNANGELIVMSPTGGETSAWNSKLIAALVNWNEQTGLGQTFDSSGGIFPTQWRTAIARCGLDSSRKVERTHFRGKKGLFTTVS
uniref:Uma2 family endonuclease n=1 Tax=Dactylococcopsis salina TaxID=292566 RepID=UPI000313C7CF|nr:Uma2 family endonuclease [Dactylococcopsis salina]